jgi:hypothetical protein
MTKKFFPHQNKNEVSKNAEYYADSKMGPKNAPKIRCRQKTKKKSAKFE